MLYGLSTSLKPCRGKSACFRSSPKFPSMRARERETSGLGFSKEVGGKMKSPRGLTSHRQHQIPCRQGGAAFTSPGQPTNGAQGQPSLMKKCLICVAEHIGMLRKGKVLVGALGSCRVVGRGWHQCRAGWSCALLGH